LLVAMLLLRPEDQGVTLLTTSCAQAKVMSPRPRSRRPLLPGSSRVPTPPLLCFALKRDSREKKGQIAHLDGSPANHDRDNLALLCFDHHDRYDSETSQSKGLL